MKKIIYIFLAAVIITGSNAIAQNQFHMGQYMLHQPFINPAATGSYEQPVAALFSKKQWVSLNGAPFIGGLNVVGPIGKNSGLGGHVYFDKIGVDRSVEVGLTYSYKIKTGTRSHLAFGITAVLNTIQSNLAELTTIDGGDPMFSANSPTFYLPNARFGVYYFRRNFYAGFAIPNLLENKVAVKNMEYVPEMAFNGANIHYYLHLGYLRRLNENFALNVSTLVKQVSAAPMQFDLNAQVVYREKLGAGLSYRSSNELLVLVNYDVLPALKLGYAYELNLGQIGKYSTGSHEILLIYKFNPPIKPIVAVPRF
jgi:type IX secretion system PorP/SprF family membrane protein